MYSATPSFGIVNGRPLFLDLVADSYFLLDPDDEASLLANLAAQGHEYELQPVNPQQPTDEIDGNITGIRPSLANYCRIFWELAKVSRALRNRPFGQVIAAITDLAASEGSGKDAEAVTIASDFLKVRRLIAYPTNCLTDSLALLSFLKTQGRSADLIFGAKLDPFAAHCWLQQGGILLNDRLERIASFTPVGVISQ